MFESYRPEINNYLGKGGYKMPGSNTTAKLAEIKIGVNPSNMLLKAYPSIAIQITSINVAWEASVITRESISARVFCCVQHPILEQAELMMYDFTDICRSLLIAHQVLPFYMEEDDNEGHPSGELHGPSVATPSVMYGNLSGDNVKAGQIDWTAEILFHHPNLLFGTVENQ